MVSEKIETPIDTSLTNSDIEQSVWPHGHESKIYTTDTRGTTVKITRRSATANETMYLEWKKENYIKVENSHKTPTSGL